MTWDQVFYLNPSDSAYSKGTNEAFDKFDRTYSWEMPTTNGSKNPAQFESDTPVVENLKILPRNFTLKVGETQQDNSEGDDADVQMGARSWTTEDPPSDD